MMVQNIEWLACPPPLLRTARANVFRHFVQIGDQLLDRLISQIGAFERLVQIVDIRLVMLVVMDFHRLGIDVGLQRIERIRQLR